MRVITSIGEIGIGTINREVILRPSFRAMAALGSPTDVVEVLADVLSPPPLKQGPEWMWRPAMLAHWKRSTWAAHSVITACCEEDISDLLGSMGERYGAYRQGPIPLDHFVPLAASLLKHGMIGVTQKEQEDHGKERSDEDYSPEFDARKFVAMATVHLGLSEAEAWNMTMTSFSLAMKAKFGKADKKRPSPKKFDDAMAFLDRVNARRKRDKQNV